MKTADSKDGMPDCWFFLAYLKHQYSPEVGVKVTRQRWCCDLLEELE